MKILAIDPGETTGFAIFVDGEFKSAWHENEWWRIVKRLKIPDKGDIVVYEDFVLYSHKASVQAGSRIVPAHVIGAIEACKYVKWYDTVSQPASIKATAKKKFDISSITGISQHAKDAILHGLYYIATKGTDEDRKRIAVFFKQ